MSKTPNRQSLGQEKSGYSPLVLRQSPAAGSPQKNLTGPPRVTRDIVADLYNNIQHWNDSHIKGAQIVKQIAILKSNDPKCYSPELEDYTNQLFEVVQTLTTYKLRFEQYVTQIEAVAKLQKNNEPLFISHDVLSLAKMVAIIAEAYVKEFKLKEQILENIAHSKTVHDAMFYATCWTHQIRITNEINMKVEILLVETGFRQFS